MRKTFRRVRLLTRIQCGSIWAIFVLKITTLAAQVPDVCLEALQEHRAHHFAAAGELYGRCLVLQPQNFEARSNLGAVMVQLARYQEAVEAYRNALTLAPSAARNALRRNLALAFYKSGQIPEAEIELAQVHGSEPNDRQTLLLLADCYLLTGEPAKTVELLDPLMDSKDPTVDYLLGTGLIRSGDLVRGKVVIDRILQRTESAESHLLLGAGMFEARDYPSSVGEFSRAVTIDPGLPLAHSYLGQALLITGDPDGASEAFRKELLLNANDFEANLKLGEILSAREKFAEAAPLLTRAVRIRPNNAEAHRAMAQAYLKTGAVAQAGVEEKWLMDRGDPLNEPTRKDGPPVGAAAPPLSLARHGVKERVTLARYRGKSPVLLVFASYSCPQFRAQVEKLNSLYERYGSRVPFLLVYIREAHAGAGWQSSVNRREGIDVPDALTMQQKDANASLCLRKLKIKFSAALDDMEGTVEKAYSAWPSRVFLVNRQGVIAFESHLDEQEFRAPVLEKSLRDTMGR